MRELMGMPSQITIETLGIGVEFLLHSQLAISWGTGTLLQDSNAKMKAGSIGWMPHSSGNPGCLQTVIRNIHSRTTSIYKILDQPLRQKFPTIYTSTLSTLRNRAKVASAVVAVLKSGDKICVAVDR